MLCFCRYVCAWCLISLFRSVCFFACVYFCLLLWGDFSLKIYPLCAPVTRLVVLVPPRQFLFFIVFWLFGRAHTTDNSHPQLALPPSRTPSLNYAPPHPFTPMNEHHGHTWTSPTHSLVHVTLFCILSTFAMWCMMALRVCLTCLLVCFGAFPLSAHPNNNPEHTLSCCCPFPAFS